MTFVAENNLPLLIAALLIGIAVGFWLFRAARRGGGEPPVTDRRDEGQGVHDETAAATKDVAGEMPGVDSHPPIPPASGPADNLQLLKGVGPKLAAQLNENGITRFDQLAGLSPTELERLDARMGAFNGRLTRDRIVEQCCYLARGDRDGFEAKFGKLGS